MADVIYKVLRRSEWREAEARGVFAGSADDLRDGFIHLSTAAQLRATLTRHFAGERDLVVVEIDPEKLDVALRWETSRGGALFPHLYGELALAAVTRRLELGGHGSDAAGELPADFP